MREIKRFPEALSKAFGPTTWLLNSNAVHSCKFEQRSSTGTHKLDRACFDRAIIQKTDVGLCGRRTLDVSEAHESPFQAIPVLLTLGAAPPHHLFVTP